jgi:hypothetical protein
MAALSRTNAGGRRLAMLGAAVLVVAMLVATACARGADDTATTPDGGVGQGSSGLFAPEERASKDSVASVAPGAAPAPMPPAGTTGADGDLTFPSVNTLGRQIIRTGSMDLAVTSVGDAFDEVRRIAEGAGGYVGDSSFSGSEASQRAYLTIRIPASQFGAVVEQLRGIAAEVRTISTGAQDVTEEFADLEATLRNLRAVERQYLELLGRANNIGEVLQVQDRLDGVRLQIERTQGRIQLLENLTSMATLQVSLSPVAATKPVVKSSGLLQTARDAWQASLETLTAIATVAVAVAVYSWWIIPIAIPAVFLARRLWRARPMPARVDTQGGAA